MKKILAIILALAMAFSLCACAAEPETPAPVATPTPAPAATPEPTPEPEDVDENALALTIEDPEWVLSSDGSYYELLNVAFCTNVVREDLQYMNIYVPAAYIDGGEINGYDAETAPIVFMNNCSGWRSSTPGKVEKAYINEGFVFVNCGARSRDAGENGKMPCAVVDLKSAVRTLRLNAEVIPGDEELIFSVGTSGGGQMSSILGASGNMDEYYSYLYENGAAGILYDEATNVYTSTIDDDIFGCMCYCPITDINNADLAYAWMRYDCGETEFVGMFGAGGTFDEFKIELQNDLAVAFCEYINELGLVDLEGEALSFDLNEDGTPNLRSGSYYDQILENMSDALNAVIAYSTADDGSFSFTEPGKGFGPNSVPGETFDSVDALFASYINTDSWLRENEDGSYSVTDMYGFLKGTELARNKDIPGFDTFDLSAENDAFGTPEEKAVYYSASVAAVLEENYDKYSALEGFDAEMVDTFIEQANREDIANQTYLMNSTHIMLDVAAGEQEADFAPHWRTRNGTGDEHTSFSVAYNLCLAAKMAGAESVDYGLVWAMGHGSDEGKSTGSFAQWVHSLAGGIVAEEEAPVIPEGAEIPDAPEKAETSAPVEGDSYTYTEVNGFGLSIDWTLVLKADGGYVLTEVNDFVGELSYEGTEYTLEGDTVVCGAMVSGPGMFEWADPKGFTATINADGTFAPVK